ncbi:MAG TPA: hypothetical protein VIJ71_08305, partial [Mycobacteriales bacterium]
HLVAIGDGSSDVSSLSATIGPAAGAVTWDGDDAIAYLPGDRNSGGTCAVMRIDLSSVGNTRCLLPTATLQSVFAQDGSTWFVAGITGTSDSGLFSLDLITSGTTPTHGAIGVLNTSAEATPFRVLQSTVVQNIELEDVANSVLVDGGNRILYDRYPGGQHQSPFRILVVSLDLATGVQTTVTTASDMNGLGATSG